MAIRHHLQIFQELGFFLLCGYISKAFEVAGLNLACRTASELDHFLIISFLIWLAHFPRSHGLTCHSVVIGTVLQMDPPILKG